MIDIRSGILDEVTTEMVSWFSKHFEQGNVNLWHRLSPWPNNKIAFGVQGALHLQPLK